MWMIAALVGFLLGAALTWGYMVHQMDSAGPAPPCQCECAEPQAPTVVNELPTMQVTDYRYNPASRRVEKR